VIGGIPKEADPWAGGTLFQTGFGFLYQTQSGLLYLDFVFKKVGTHECQSTILIHLTTNY